MLKHDHDSREFLFCRMWQNDLEAEKAIAAYLHVTQVVGVQISSMVAESEDFCERICRNPDY